MSANFQHHSQRYYRSTVDRKQRLQQKSLAANHGGDCRRQATVSVSSQRDLLETSLQTFAGNQLNDHQLQEQHFQQMNMHHDYRQAVGKSQQSNQHQMETPCKQIAQLKLTNSGNKANKNRKSRKLLGSKSLSQLIMPKSLMFIKSNKGNHSDTTIAATSGGSTSETISSCVANGSKSINGRPQLIKGNSFTNSSYQQHDGSLVATNQPNAMDSLNSSNGTNGSQSSTASFTQLSQYHQKISAQQHPKSMLNGSESLLVCFPRQSTSNSLQHYRPPLGSSSSISITPTNLSPIVQCSQIATLRNVVVSTPDARHKNGSILLIGDENLSEEDQFFEGELANRSIGSSGCANDSKPYKHDQVQSKKPKKKQSKSFKCNDIDGESAREDANVNSEARVNGTDQTAKMKSYRPFRGTRLVLRDVKNSLGLRMRAKQESQAFRKLNEEIATPPTTVTKSTKLYSPFNIYTPRSNDNDANQLAGTRPINPAGKPSAAMGANGEVKARKQLYKMMVSKAKRQHQQTGRSSNTDKLRDNEPATDSGYCSMLVDQQQANKRHQQQTPKSRIALRHKKHLMEASKQFQFDSPTGRLRETVRDVEQLQQCIEDISKAIEARSAGSHIGLMDS